MSACGSCGHPWSEHTTAAGRESEHECGFEVGGFSDGGWGSTDCGCMAIPPGHAPDWTWCTPCAGPEPTTTETPSHP